MDFSEKINSLTRKELVFNCQRLLELSIKQDKLIEKQNKKLDKFKFDKTVIPQKTQAHFLKVQYFKKNYALVLDCWTKETRKGFCIIPEKRYQYYMKSWIVNAMSNCYTKIEIGDTPNTIWTIIQDSLVYFYGLKKRSKNVLVVETVL